MVRRKKSQHRLAETGGELLQEVIYSVMGARVVLRFPASVLCVVNVAADPETGAPGCVCAAQVAARLSTMAIRSRRICTVFVL